MNLTPQELTDLIERVAKEGDYPHVCRFAIHRFLELLREKEDEQ